MIEINKKNFGQSVKDFFTKDIGFKILSILFAIMLWGYVIADINPYRVKTIENVATSFDGEAELMAKGLCVRGDREELLREVDVAVKTQIRNYYNVSASAVSASINLRNISKAGEYEIPVTANISSALGVIQQVSPATVKVDIDSLVSKTIPISCTLEGEVPDGYWADLDNISSTAKIDIQGAKTDVSRISHAECVVNLTGKTYSIFGTFDLVLYDSEDHVIDSSVAVGTLPSSTVVIPIYAVKEVPVDVEGSLLGLDKLAPNYELDSYATTPQTIRIVGAQDNLENVESLQFEPVSVSGAKESMAFEAQLIVPENVTLLDSSTVSVTLDITEMTDTMRFETLPVQVTGLGKGLTAELDPEAIDLDVEGRVGLLSVLKRSSIKVDVDVTGLGPGTYDIPVTVYIRDDDATMELITTPSVQVIRVVIS